MIKTSSKSLPVLLVSAAAVALVEVGWLTSAVVGAQVTATVVESVGTVERMAHTGGQGGDPMRPPLALIKVREEVVVVLAEESDGGAHGAVDVARWLPGSTVLSVRELQPSGERASPRGSKLAWRMDNQTGADGFLRWTSPSVNVGASRERRFSLVYTVPGAVMPLPTSPYQGLALVQVRWPLTVVAIAASGDTATTEVDAATASTITSNLHRSKWHSGAISVAIHVRVWDPSVQRVLCGQRPTALYSRSGFAIRSGSGCHACPLARGEEWRERGVARVSDDGEGCQRLVNNVTSTIDGGFQMHATPSAQLSGSNASVWVMEMTVGTELSGVGFASPSRTEYCLRLIHDQDVSFTERFIGDIVYPLKVLVFVVPAATVGMIMVVRLGRGSTLAGFVVAVGSNFVDFGLLGAAGVFPSCSAAVSGKR